MIRSIKAKVGKCETEIRTKNKEIHGKNGVWTKRILKLSALINDSINSSILKNAYCIYFGLDGPYRITSYD